MDDLVSLDDIIKKSKANKATARGRDRKKGGLKTSGDGKTNKGPKSAPLRKNQGGKTNGAIRDNRPKVIEDARLKIIQKNRHKLKDARDKLSQMAKQSDARLKLQKLRSNHSKAPELISASRKNGRPSRFNLPTSKVSQQRLGGRTSASSFLTQQSRNMNYRLPQTAQPRYANNLLNYNDGFSMNQQTIRRTVNNDYNSPMPLPPSLFDIKPTVYHDWDKPASDILSKSHLSKLFDNDRPRDYKVISRSTMAKTNSQPSYKDDYSLSSKSRTILSDNLISKYQSSKNSREAIKPRLEPSPKGRSTAARAKPASDSNGYRIVVSNLQANVTHEDIKELFEDVGELVVSRLVRPGIAEVIYKTLKDATKAVETYHNRQLDGHPMKCLLVNSRPKTSANISNSRPISGSRISTHSPPPNLGTIHRALFN